MNKITRVVAQLRNYALTCQDGEPPFGGELSFPRSVQDVQQVGLPPDVVHLAVEVLAGGHVALLEPSAQEAPHQVGLTDLRRSEHHDAPAVPGLDASSWRAALRGGGSS